MNKGDLNITLYQGFPILTLVSIGAARFLVVVEASWASGMFITPFIRWSEQTTHPPKSASGDNWKCLLLNNYCRIELALVTDNSFQMWRPTGTCGPSHVVVTDTVASKDKFLLVILLRSLTIVPFNKSFTGEESCWSLCDFLAMIIWLST